MVASANLQIARVIQVSEAISTFIRPTLWRRGNCHCTGSLPSKMSPRTGSNGAAVASAAQVQTPKPLILPWKHTRGRLSQQEPPWTNVPPWKHAGHQQSSPGPLRRFTVLYSAITKDHKPKGQCIEWFILCAPLGSGPLPPFSRQATGHRVCSPQNTAGVCSRAGTLLLGPHDPNRCPQWRLLL